MEIAIPVVALGGLFIMNNQNKKKDSLENFSQRTGQYENRNLPNIDVPNTNYPSEYPIQSPANDLTSQLSTVNKYSGQGVYTDKYFNPNSKSSIIGSTSSQNSNMFSNQVPNPATAQYVSLTGEKVGSDYFQHNNMAPFFGSHLRTIRTDANSTEGIMDNYTGAGSQIITKTERAPLFAPQENYQYAFGAPNMSDFYQSRVNPSAKMSNVKPFAEEHVGPGIGAGYGNTGVGGYNSGLMARDMYLPRTVDELRVANHQKAGGIGLYGHEGPAMSSITSRGILGQMEKNRVDTSFELGPDRLFTTTGVGTAPTSRAINILKDGSRAETTVEYIGGAGAANEAAYVDGEYMPSKHIDLGAVPLAPAYRTGANGGSEADYGYKSKMVYQNNRSANEQETYFGAFGSAIGAVVAPLLDALRPSRRENTIGTLRPYQNPGSTVSNSYVFNPADRPATTIRETTEDSKGHLFIDRNQRGGAYEVAGNQPVINNRMSQNASYIGGGGTAVKESRRYDAEYNQRNNDTKSSTLASFTPAGNMGLFSGDIHMTAKAKDNFQKNNRALDPTMPGQSPSIGMMGQQSANQPQLYSNIQLDRTTPDMLSQLKGNPFALSHLNGL
jgi:hypothetical protein